MATNKTYDFSDWTGLTQTVCTGVDIITDDSNPVFADANLAAGENVLYDAALPSGITNGTEWNLYARVRSNDVASNSQAGIFLVEDGEALFLYFVARFKSGGLSNFYRGFNATSICTIIDNQVPSSYTFVSDKWYWLKIYARPNIADPTKIDYSFSYNDDGGVTRPSSWISLPTLDYTSSFFASPISKMGIKFMTGGTIGAGKRMQADDLRIEIANEDKSAFAGFSASVLANMMEIYAYWGTGGKGSARINIGDQENAIAATLQSDLGKLITLTTPYGLEIFKGEYKDYMAPTDSLKPLVLDSIGQKLVTTRCKTDPRTILPFELRHSIDKIIHEKNGDFPDLSDKMIEFTKTTPREIIVHPTAVTYFESDESTGWTPDTIEGALLNLYYHQPDLPHPDNILRLEHDGTENNEDRVVIVFEPYILDGSGFDLVELRTIWYPEENFGWSNHPSLRIYNYDTSAWEELYDTQDGGGSKIYEGHGSRFPYPTDHTRDIMSYASVVALNPLTDYMDIGAANNSNYKRHRMRFGYDLGDENNDGQEKVRFYYIELKIRLDTDQIITYALGEIDSSTSTTITLKAAGASVPNLTELPSEEGFHHGTQVKVSYWVDKEGSGIAQDIIANSDTALTLDFNASGADKITELDDLTWENIRPMLQKWAGVLNGMWWINYGGDEIVFATPDNFVDSGVTLTEADVPDGRYAHNISIRNIATKVTVVGQGEVFATTETTPEFTLGGDDEEVVIREPTISSTIEAKTQANNKKFVHESARREFRMTLNYSKPRQDYSPLIVGRLVTIKFPNAGDTSECDYSGADKVVIVSMEFNRNKDTGWQDFFTLAMQRRYV